MLFKTKLSHCIRQPSSQACFAQVLDTDSHVKTLSITKAVCPGATETELQSLYIWIQHKSHSNLEDFLRSSPHCLTPQNRRVLFPETTSGRLEKKKQVFCACKCMRLSSAIKAETQTPRGTLMTFRHQSSRGWSQNPPLLSSKPPDGAGFFRT